jgi:hypothetical protein
VAIDDHRNTLSPLVVSKAPRPASGQSSAAALADRSRGTPHDVRDLVVADVCDAADTVARADERLAAPAPPQY